MSTTEAEADTATAAAITIGKPAADLRSLWLQLDTQSRIWGHFAEVTPTGDRTAEWVARGPAGGEYRWRTAVVDDGPATVRWASEEGADVPNVGALRFRPAPGDRGTELHLDVRFDPPGGAIGEAIAKLFHIAPREIVRTALYRFRALALTGEIPTTEPQPAARSGGADR
ncbi:SRPBCC family protein [Aureimonas jatrophae]|uniref:Polyketide cyclase / dehydrase and lipid transport n=1 Tax=Aureimonas jatrophae TaxID=1166073 RepID=A0A1H0LFD8_9HYPH|nr:SRPBCC family protein [Aureimonas jatrophae]MBB3952497.1 putative membrane protein [Aureimonas jatrophae]SDO66889.1 Polyketide cyclase / dehydrase and lipid transport [Aureimonas jatrophae]